MLKKLALILLSSALLIFSACSEEDLSDFQRNASDPEFSIFTLVEGYPSLSYIWDNMNSDAVNDKLSETMDDYSDEFIRFSAIQSDIMKKNPEALVNLVNKAGLAMDTLLDEEEKYYYSPFVESLYGDRGSKYQTDFYALLERISNAETEGLRPSVMNIARTIIGYIIDTKDPADLNKFMNKAIGAMEDMEREDFVDLSKVLGKILMSANYPMYLDGTDLVTDPGNLITDPEDINSNSLNTDLGNITKGIIALLDGSAEMVSADAELKDMLFGLLDEVPVLYAAKTDNGKDLPHVMSELITNIETLFLPLDNGETSDVTVGGKALDRNEYYQTADGAATYIDSDLKTTMKELLPALQKIMIGAGKNGSIIHDTNGKGDTPLEVISGALKKLKGIGIDLKSHDIRSAVNEMIQKDGDGKVRTSGSTKLSALDHLLFTLMASGTFGYKDGGTGVGASMDTNWGHWQGAPTGGVLTVNDSLASMTSHLPDGLIGFLNSTLSWLCGGAADMDTYTLCLEAPAGDYVYRSKDDFSVADLSNGSINDKNGDGFNDFKFFLYPNYPANFLLSGNCIGDGGVPNGGYGISDPGKENGFSYAPFESRGIGEKNTGRWVLGWIARAVWEGEGPYYYADPDAEQVEIGGTTYYKYLRPDGSAYAYVNKDSGSPASWIYKYFTDASYDVDLDSDGERDSHFKSTWETDAYLVENNGSYYAPGNMTGSANSANRFTLQEKLQPADFATRECASQEEAMVKNFQWLLNEKKFLYVMPLRIIAMDMLHATVLIRLEGNGIQGVANIRKSSNPLVVNHGSDWVSVTGRWCRPASESTTDDLGAGRVIVDVKQGNVLNILKMNAVDSGGSDFVIGVWDEVLGGGYVLPDVVGANFGPMQRMVYMIEDMVSSADAGPSGAYWSQRSALFPVLGAIIGELHKRSYYEVPSADNYNINDSVNNRVPFKIVSDALIPALAKPLFYFQKSGTTPVNAWKPRVVSGNYLNNDEDNPGDRSDPEYQPKPNRTLVSLLGENVPGDGDGLLPLLNKTEMIPKLLAMLQKLSETSFDDVEAFDKTDMTTWGIRRKIFFALEQLMTGMKVSKAKVYQNNWIDSGLFEQWQFAKRDCDLDVDKSLDSMFWEDLGGTAGVFDLGIDEQGSLAELPDGTQAVADERLSSMGRVVEATLDHENIATAEPITVKMEDSNGDLQPILVTVSNGLVSGSDVDGYGRFIPSTGDIYFVLKDEPTGKVTMSYSYTQDWQSFYDAFDDLGVFIEADSEYYVYDDVIQVLKSTLDAMTYDGNLAGELKGALYTLGKLFARYNGDRWVYQGEDGFDFLYTMMKEDLPVLQRLMLDDSGDNINAVLVLVNDLMKQDGFVDAVLDSVDAMDVTDAFEWREIFADLGALLKDPLMTEVDSDLWPTLADMMDDMSEAIIGSRETVDENGETVTNDALKEIYKDYGFQYNGI